MNKTFVGLGIIVVLILAGAGVYIAMQQNPTPVACTMEAKLCPDGSAVGRSGPNCEFAPCPSPTPIATTTPPAPTTSGAVTLKLNVPQTVLGTTITAWAVTEDGRCASDVQCVWAGRVKVAFNIKSPSGDSSKELEVGQSITTENLIITLKDVTPYPISTHKIQDDEYRILITVSKRSAGTGTLQATMTIGPICPVEREGMPCKPTPEMFAARKVSVYRTNQTTLVTTLTPDAEGKMSAALPVGDYWVTMPTQGVGGVAGLPATIHITAEKITTLTIDVDTGIR